MLLEVGVGCSKKSVQIKAELQEELVAESLPVMGTIPEWLSGTLVRNGPVRVTIDGQSNAHWFDGLAMLHAFSIDKGAVTYTNKFLRTQAYATVFEKGSLDYSGFASDPCRSLFKRFLTFFTPSSHLPEANANINVAKLADSYVALYETPLPVRFDLKTLETLGVLDYADKLPHNKIWESAHPHVDHAKKETVNYLVDFGRHSTYTVYRIEDGSSTREVIARIPAENPSYMHSFALTENYVIFTAFPFVVRPIDLLTKGEAFIKNFSWKPELGTTFIVVDRHTGSETGRFSGPPFFAFHHANAFEQEGKIYLDIVCYNDASVISKVAHYGQRDDTPSNVYNQRLMRFTLPLKEGTISSEVLFEQPNEFPRINEAYDGHPYRYLYLADARGPTSQSDIRPLYKFDTTTKKPLTWQQAGCFPGEPVFAQAPDAKEEDDGVVMAVVHSAQAGASFLLILDAKTFQEIARAEVPHVIPAGLHGQYFGNHYLYKVLTKAEWEASQGRETLVLPESDSAFIHFSLQDQLERITAKYFSAYPEYVVLKIDMNRLPGTLVFEANPGGTAKYYHLYNGSIPLTAVLETTIVKNKSAG